VAYIEPDLQIKVGDLLANKYRVEHLLGTGGMGVVVAARHVQLGELVAIKFLASGRASNINAVERFTREAQASVKIRNEHIARVLDVGQLDNGTPFMVMEYLEGNNLSKWLNDRGPLSIALAVELILQTCEAIAEAHTLGIVHRDLKPTNLFLVRQPDGSPSVKVLDFGISKVEPLDTQTAPCNLTESACILGSPFYMSPEQFRSARDVNVCTDLWSLGVILFELLSGRIPFSANSAPELYPLIVTQSTPSVRELRAEVPEKLDQIIQRCLARTQSHRYQSVAAFAQDLRPFASLRAIPSIDRILGTEREAKRSTIPREAKSTWPELPAIHDSQIVNFVWNKPVSLTRPKRVLTAIGVGVALISSFISWAWATRSHRVSVPTVALAVPKNDPIPIEREMRPLISPSLSTSVPLPVSEARVTKSAKETRKASLSLTPHVTPTRKSAPKTLKLEAQRADESITTPTFRRTRTQEQQVKPHSVYDDMD
jgi:serine/threonine-protein kinase